MRLERLFVAALLGVITIVGLALAALTPYALIPYAAAVAVAARTAVRRARALQPADGRTCQCCTSTVFDAVEVR